MIEDNGTKLTLFSWVVILITADGLETGAVSTKPYATVSHHHCPKVGVLVNGEGY